MCDVIWYSPKLEKIDVEALLKSVSVKASSYETDDCYGGNILKGNIGDPAVPGLPGGDWALYCIEYGPLGGCDNWAACSSSGMAILSSENDCPKA